MKIRSHPKSTGLLGLSKQVLLATFLAGILVASIYASPLVMGPSHANSINADWLSSNLLQKANAISGDASDLSNNAGNSDNPTITTSGGNVYVSWYDDTDQTGMINIRTSNDGGTSFNPAKQITNASNQVLTLFPIALAAAPAGGGSSDDSVYLAWTDSISGSNQVWFARSADSGQTFEPAINLSNDSGIALRPQLAALDDGSGTLYAVWGDNSNTTSGNFQVFFVKSTDGGQTFSNVTALSNGDTESARFPQLAVSDSNVYVVWADTVSGEIFARSSSDGGSSFDAEANVSQGSQGDFGPFSLQSRDIVASSSGDNIYVSWLGAAGNVYLANSTDAGASFGSAEDLSDEDGVVSGTDSAQVSLSSSTGNAFVAWSDSSSGISKIAGRMIIDGHLGSILDLSQSSSNSVEPSLAASSDGKFYVAWTDNDNFKIYSVQVAESGDETNGPVDISTDSGASDSFHPEITTGAGDGGGGSDNVFVTWSGFSDDQASQDIFLAISPNYAVPRISIADVSDTNPKWDTEITVSGTTTNSASGESVTIDWGDNSNTTGISISDSDGTWGPVAHTYDASAISTNPNNLVASLINNSDNSTLAESSPCDDCSISVQKHTTSLKLNSILGVKEGATVKVKGSLTDSDSSGAPIADASISFSGSGGDGLVQDVATKGSGSFNSSGSAPSEVGDGWFVEAAFAGDDAYDSSSANGTYSTAPSSAKSVSVSAGSNVNVDLNTTGFDSSILFDSVKTAGVVYVSECAAPSDSSRFELINADLCVRIVPHVTLEDGSSAHVSISLAGQDLPGSHTATDIDVYRIDLAPSDTTTDITESRDSDSSSVTGNAGAVFSDFVAGVAIHPEIQPDAFVQQVFVTGDSASNTILYRNLTAPTISLDKSKYSVGQTATLTVTDLNANTDSNLVEFVQAFVNSTSSSPTKLDVNLTETAKGSGEFVGHFKVSSGATSNSTHSLEVGTNDKISVSYTSNTRPSLSATFSGVTESGIVTISEYTVDQAEGSIYKTPFIEFGNAVNMTLNDGSIGPDGYVNVTMSFASHYIGDNEPAKVGIFQYQPVKGWVDISYFEPDGHDLDKQLAIGHTTIPSGIFSLGLCSTECGANIFTGGGGAGGGGFTGRGVVVDFVAHIAESSSSGGGGSNGGGGGGTSTTTSLGSSTEHLNAGSDSSLEASLSPTSTITIKFENVVSPGDVTIEQKPVSGFADLLTDIKADSATISFENGALVFTTHGNVFDVKPSSGVTYQGMIEITLPFDKNLISASNARLLHYDGNEWQDITTNVDYLNGKITGKVSSLSPLVVTTVNDGTFGPAYFEENPMQKLADIRDSDGSILKSTDSQPIIIQSQDGSIVTSGTILSGTKISLTNTIKNLQRVTQNYAYYVEVFDSNGVVVYLEQVQTSALQEGQSQHITTYLDTFNEKGKYTVKVFVIDEFGPVPLLLKTAATTSFEVT